MDFDEIANEITANAAHLRDEVTTLAELFAETAFLGNSRNLRYAHCGYLMACMGQIDIMSLCMFGKGKGWGEQTRRMRDFIDQFLYEGKAEEHRVAVQLMRHTLMHTGDLRPVYDPPRKIAYTWQIFFGDAEEPEREHYSVTPEILAEQQEVIALATVVRLTRSGRSTSDSTGSPPISAVRRRNAPPRYAMTTNGVTGVSRSFRPFDSRISGNPLRSSQWEPPITRENPPISSPASP